MESNLRSRRPRYVAWSGRDDEMDEPMKTEIRQFGAIRYKGSILCLVMLSILLMSLMGFGLLTVSHGVGQQTAVVKTEAAAMAAAEAGFEQAVFWMSQQPDMISALNEAGARGSLSYENSRCDYSVQMAAFLGSSPIYEIRSVGHSGIHERIVQVYMIQAVGGWAMGMCRIPTGSGSTSSVNYVEGEIIDMPIHINSYGDPKDSTRDIFLSGDPLFLRAVSMSESRYSSGGFDKYGSVMKVFDNGIYFNQPSSRITDSDTVKKKVVRFRDSTAAAYKFTPKGPKTVPNSLNAVQLEFHVQNNVGKVRITNNCSVRGFRQSSDSYTYDFMIEPDNPDLFKRYYIYAYHVRSKLALANGDVADINVEDTYVQQTVGGIKSEPGGQIYVDGNVILGSGDIALLNNNTVKGRITIVATGNIWIANSIQMDGDRDADGKPSATNTNALGLIAKGVVKVVDPGMSDYSYVDDQPVVHKEHDYVPIGINDSGTPVTGYKRHLPDPVVVEAGITVGGGGWGAENVQRGSYGGRKEASGTQDALIVRGTLTEVCRGVVGIVRTDGFLKNYYLDERLLTGILPGDIWLRGKFVPLPAGWSDFRAVAGQ